MFMTSKQKVRFRSGTEDPNSVPETGLPPPHILCQLDPDRVYDIIIQGKSGGARGDRDAGNGGEGGRDASHQSFRPTPGSAANSPTEAELGSFAMHGGEDGPQGGRARGPEPSGRDDACGGRVVEADNQQDGTGRRALPPAPPPLVWVRGPAAKPTKVAGGTKKQKKQLRQMQQQQQALAAAAVHSQDLQNQHEHDHQHQPTVQLVVHRAQIRAAQHQHQHQQAAAAAAVAQLLAGQPMRLCIGEDMRGRCGQQPAPIEAEGQPTSSPLVPSTTAADPDGAAADPDRPDPPEGIDIDDLGGGGEAQAMYRRAAGFTHHPREPQAAPLIVPHDGPQRGGVYGGVSAPPAEVSEQLPKDWGMRAFLAVLPARLRIEVQRRLAAGRSAPEQPGRILSGPSRRNGGGGGGGGCSADRYLVDMALDSGRDVRLAFSDGSKEYLTGIQVTIPEALAALRRYLRTGGPTGDDRPGGGQTWTPHSPAGPHPARTLADNCLGPQRDTHWRPPGGGAWPGEAPRPPYPLLQVPWGDPPPGQSPLPPLPTLQPPQPPPSWPSQAPLPTFQPASQPTSQPPPPSHGPSSQAALTQSPASREPPVSLWRALRGKEEAAPSPVLSQSQSAATGGSRLGEVGGEPSRKRSWLSRSLWPRPLFGGSAGGGAAAETGGGGNRQQQQQQQQEQQEQQSGAEVAEPQQQSNEAGTRAGGQSRPRPALEGQEELWRRRQQQPQQSPSSPGGPGGCYVPESQPYKKARCDGYDGHGVDRTTATAAAAAALPAAAVAAAAAAPRGVSVGMRAGDPAYFHGGLHHLYGPQGPGRDRGRLGSGLGGDHASGLGGGFGRESDMYDTFGDAAEASRDPAARDLFGSDNRCCLPGTLHRVSALRDPRDGGIYGLTYRVGRHLPGVASLLADVLTDLTGLAEQAPSASTGTTAAAAAGAAPAALSGGALEAAPTHDPRDLAGSLLLVGRPGSGKTTLLRDIARLLADDLALSVVVVDTSNEIAGDDVLPHSCIGSARRIMVGERSQLHRVMLEAVQNHGPEVVVVDEISNKQEVDAARTISQRGVMLVATAHGTDLDSLLHNAELNALVGGLQSVILGDSQANRTNGGGKMRVERRGEPTFRTLVEVLGRGRLRLRPDVAASVDALLREGRAPAGGAAGAGRGGRRPGPGPARPHSAPVDVASLAAWWPPGGPQQQPGSLLTLRHKLAATPLPQQRPECHQLDHQQPALTHSPEPCHGVTAAAVGGCNGAEEEGSGPGPSSGEPGCYAVEGEGTSFGLDPDPNRGLGPSSPQPGHRYPTRWAGYHGGGAEGVRQEAGQKEAVWTLLPPLEQLRSMAAAEGPGGGCAAGDRQGSAAEEVGGSEGGGMRVRFLRPTDAVVAA